MEKEKEVLEKLYKIPEEFKEFQNENKSIFSTYKNLPSLSDNSFLQLDKYS